MTGAVHAWLATSSGDCASSGFTFMCEFLKQSGGRPEFMSTSGCSGASPTGTVHAVFVMTGRDWVLLLFCALCWGSAYTFNRVIVAELPSLTITAARLVVAASFLTLLATLQGVRLPPFGRQWQAFFVFTLFSNVVPFLFVLRGQRETASGLAAVIGATTPLFVILLAHVFTTDERMQGRKVAGVIVGMSGVAVVVGTDALSGWSSGLAAKLSLVFAALLYAIGAVYSKRIVGLPPIAMAAMQMICGLVITFPLAILIDQPWSLPPPSTKVVLAVIGTAIIGSSLSAIAYFHILKRAGATNAMLVTLLVPITPILLGGVLFGERLLAREVIGATIIGAALLLIDGRPLRWIMQRMRRKMPGDR